MMNKSEQEQQQQQQHFVLHIEDYWRQHSIYELGWQLGMLFLMIMKKEDLKKGNEDS